MSVEIASLDPGTTTGVATLEQEEYRTFQLRPDLYPHPHEALFDVLSELKPKVILYEAFHFRQDKTGAVFTGVEYIGVIELWAQLNCTEIIKLNPEGKNGFWSNDKLKALSIYKPGLPHAMDATRILLRHRMKADPKWFSQALLALKAKL